MRVSDDLEKDGGVEHDVAMRLEPILPVSNATEKDQPPKASIHSAVYVTAWIAASSGTILYNKWLLDTLGFRFPIVLTTWHMFFATCMTQLLSRTTTLLDGRKNMNMTMETYVRAILPIGFFFSLSLIFGNKAYLYLSVAFIQMLKATNPVVVLLITWGLKLKPFDMKTLLNVSLIVIGVIIASFGEIKFVLAGFLCQVAATAFEATRLVLIERLLSAFKMDAMVSLYYYAPICTVMNLVASLLFEVPDISMQDIHNVGIANLFANALVAFLLNVSLVLLIGKTSSLVLTLCGVLKDILLVAASIMIWGTPVTSTQFLGYSVALSGLVYYKLGGDQLKQQIAGVRRTWTEFGVKKPAVRHACVIGLVVFLMVVLVGGLVPSFAGKSAGWLRELLGGSKLAS
ncbi:glucose-6-phosphate/phosphate and phosphoenolpyruvate/phosphate antiporter [Tothia fuscella]|uniref:Glucose-6-phosphate/phosphate and phosphoenolpyruvate/phosphate antiporter n=1 Tax=Tothia fuscella TaxID=1048955 RepID=A0A9P4NSI4_9PEZI|nr:glucose-6-phosphate/phosphate and phosphoenolpyruvate/phosphate antiporter [Tothia fuscella]